MYECTKRCISNEFLTDSEITASVVHIPFKISNNSELVSFPDKTGSGTENDPYIIENLEITNNGATAAIGLSNINMHLIIRNCTIVNQVNKLNYQNVPIHL